MSPGLFPAAERTDIERWMEERARERDLLEE